MDGFLQEVFVFFKDVASERSTVLTRCIKVYYIKEVQEIGIINRRRSIHSWLFVSSSSKSLPSPSF